MRAKVAGFWRKLCSLDSHAWRAAIKRMTLILGVLAPAAAILVPVLVSLISQSLDSRTLLLSEVSVPPSLAARGYSSVVIARKIGDAYYRMRNEAAVTAKSKTLVVGEPSVIGEPKLAVSSPNESLASAFAYALSFLHLSRRSEISGEIVAAENKGFQLTLRLNGSMIDGSPIKAETPEDLTHPAAEAIMRSLQPSMLATWYYRHENYATATALAKNVLLWAAIKDENVPAAHNLLGLIYRNSGDYVGAANEFRESARFDGYAAQPHINLSTVYFSQSSGNGAMLYSALWEAQRAVQLDPHSSPAHITLGNAYLKFNRLKDSTREYLVALAYDRTNGIAHSNLGYAYYLQKRPADAVAEYLRAKAYAPSDLYPRNNLAKLYWQTGQLDAAAKEYQAVTEIGPRDQLVYLNLATVRVQQASSPHADVGALLKKACETLTQGSVRFQQNTDFKKRNPRYLKDAQAFIESQKLSCPLPQREA